MIDGIVLHELKQIIDDRGRVMHMVRNDSPVFEKFGEIYFSEIMPNVVKAWKYHEKMTQLISVPVGMIGIVVYDDREGSKTRGDLVVFEIGKDNYKLLKIPPKLWYGFKCISQHPALLANCADLPHDPFESKNVDLHDKSIPFQW